MPNKVDITNMRFGSLVAIRETLSRDSAGSVIWTCLCDCGKEHSASSRMLRFGSVKSCGCAQLEYCQSGNARRRHGYAKSSTYAIWNSMKQRCHSPNSHAYKDYGQRGIYVCDQWRNSFDEFLADMGERPAGMSIERINNDGPYAPYNCKWATPKEQAMNRRKPSVKSVSNINYTN